MSSVAIPGEFTSADPAANPGGPMLPEFAGIPHPVRSHTSPEAAVRRRASVQQGRALEEVGHAIEYLVDSRLFIASGLDERAEQEAVQVLMRVSRAIFAECAEVVPLRRQMGLWIEKRLPWSA